MCADILRSSSVCFGNFDRCVMSERSKMKWVGVKVHDFEVPKGWCSARLALQPCGSSIPSWQIISWRLRLPVGLLKILAALNCRRTEGRVLRYVTPIVLTRLHLDQAR